MYISNYHYHRVRLSAVYYYLVTPDEIPVYLIYLHYPGRTARIQADASPENATMELQTASALTRGLDARTHSRMHAARTQNTALSES